MSAKLLAALIGIYQRHFRCLLPNACRFHPSCSEYTRLALLKYGLFRGIFRGTLRLARCNPFNPHYGNDPLK